MRETVRNACFLQQSFFDLADVSATLEQVEHVCQRVVISVQDHGTGIKASELKRIFEPFYRSPQVAAAQIPGTGLWLPSAKHLAEAMVAASRLLVKWEWAMYSHCS
jgi:signal transduction histidine kinase